MAEKKLTDEQAQEIRNLLRSRECTQRDLAIRYGVSRATISGIWRGKFYREERG